MIEFLMILFAGRVQHMGEGEYRIKTDDPHDGSVWFYGSPQNIWRQLYSYVRICQHHPTSRWRVFVSTYYDLLCEDRRARMYYTLDILGFTNCGEYTSQEIKSTNHALGIPVYNFPVRWAPYDTDREQPEWDKDTHKWYGQSEENWHLITMGPRILWAESESKVHDYAWALGEEIGYLPSEYVCWAS